MSWRAVVFKANNSTFYVIKYNTSTGIVNLMFLNRSALVNGYAFELKGDVKSKLAASFHFKVCSTLPLVTDECLGVVEFSNDEYHGGECVAGPTCGLLCIQEWKRDTISCYVVMATKLLLW